MAANAQIVLNPFMCLDLSGFKQITAQLYGRFSLANFFLRLQSENISISAYFAAYAMVVTP